MSGRCEKSGRLLIKSRGTVPGGSVSESPRAAMRGLTRYFRAAVARKYSVCPRIARQGQSGRLCFVQTTSPQCEDKSEKCGQTRSPLRFFHIFLARTDEKFPRSVWKV